MFLLILVLFIIILIVKYLTNKETIYNNCQNENDLANIKYARKYYTKTRTSYVALIFSLVALIVLLLSQYTDIDKYIIDYFSTDFYQEKPLDTTLYYIPIYILVMRFIVIEVKVGDYLYKYFQVEEPHLEENPLKSILYKLFCYNHMVLLLKFCDEKSTQSIIIIHQRNGIVPGTW